MLKSKTIKKLQKQQELEQHGQEEDERREKLKAKRQRANELAEGTPDDKEKNGTSSKSSTGRRVGRPSGSESMDHA